MRLRLKSGAGKRALIGALIGTATAGLVSYGNAVMAGAAVSTNDIGKILVRSAVGGAIGGAIGALATTDSKRSMVTAALGGVAGLTLWATVKRAMLPGAAGMSA